MRRKRNTDEKSFTYKCVANAFLKFLIEYFIMCFQMAVLIINSVY